ncbi:hypothetical protein [Tautonia sociabilis]|uniref:Uncharacterized protein n=1 Tax=Tautonia sociabilis TaxID=2080755 RepID=A0A432MGF3_9BACT|nr:hypothetical protein [Tautonia sociabilis]RUL85552.1 hypothetical protein TsocGM_18410 [Tautonia sociabilis]
MTRFLALSACAALALSIGPMPDARAGDPAFPGRDVRSSVPVLPTPVLLPAPISPTGAVVPLVPTSIPVRRPLGTFRQDPTLVSYTGPGTTGTYTPGGLPRQYGAMSFYGPFSRLRSLPQEVVTYSRGYDGVLRQTSSVISYEYTDPRQYKDTTLVPTGFGYDLSTGARRRSGFGRYLLGQE